VRVAKQPLVATLQKLNLSIPLKNYETSGENIDQKPY
jgi:hypothetical protein